MAFSLPFGCKREDDVSNRSASSILTPNAFRRLSSAHSRRFVLGTPSSHLGTLLGSASRCRATLSTSARAGAFVPLETSRRSGLVPVRAQRSSHSSLQVRSHPPRLEPSWLTIPQAAREFPTGMVGSLVPVVPLALGWPPPAAALPPPSSFRSFLAASLRWRS